MAELPDFAPVDRTAGYLPLRDHALIGDGTSAGLVGRDGRVVWLCVPRVDCPPLFAAILDARSGGAFTVAPADLVESRQYYLPDTAVVLTELRGRSGCIRVSDALALRTGADLREDSPAARHELVRCIEVLDGPVEVDIAVEPRGGAEAVRRGGAMQLRCPQQPDLSLQLRARRQLQGCRDRVRLEHGERLNLVLGWHGNATRYEASTGLELLDHTAQAWRRWVEPVAPDVPRQDLVRRSAITLKLLDHFPNGAIVAAPTSSLPECIGGQRNWDYRYTWIRDAAFSVYALRKVGFPAEAAAFLGWVLDAVEDRPYPGVMLTIDGTEVPPEREDPSLEGYRGSQPVRWGNAARDQHQQDSYGEILDCAYQWARHDGALDEHLWSQLRRLADHAGDRWAEPGHGLWEVRTEPRRFTYTAGICQVAVDRAARLAQSFGLEGNLPRWRRQAEAIREAILERAWDPKAQALCQHLDGGGLDASVLALPLRRVIPVRHPRMVATTAAIRRRLEAGHGLVHRYLVSESPDGVPGTEGAFLLCSFWLVEVLAYQGAVDEAEELLEQLCRLPSHLGLLPEQVDPDTLDFLGNYPQALSHVGMISASLAVQEVRTGQASLALPEPAAPVRTAGT